MELNEVLKQLPPHLMQFVIDQPYNEYTWQDHAVWRYVMRQNYNHLSQVAHEAYIEGLRITGIEIDKIANMYGMNRILEKIGWAAASVDGFIPPQAFMEFQAYKVLVIAADIRTIDHIEYTPAPDIIHESAGHAPIIAEPQYAKYLIDFGKAGSKAFSSRKDNELYEAIRHLSIIKEDPHTLSKEVIEAEHRIIELQKDMGPPSEMALARNLHWWTVEYGLIGTPENFKIYGAGLLSSIGESKSCLDPKVKKIPYTISAKDFHYDITKPQPQLFVTPNFDHLSDVLDEFVSTMSWKVGGFEGLKNAINSENLATCVLSSGLQISGVFVEALKENGLSLIRTKGHTALAINERQLEGHGKENYTSGYFALLGYLKETRKPLENFDTSDCEAMGILAGRHVILKLQSGICAEGELEDIVKEKDKIVLLKFKSLALSLEGKVFLKALNYGLGIGAKVISVFAGAADVSAFQPDVQVPSEKTHKIFYDEKSLRLHQLYGQVRRIRESKTSYLELEFIWKKLKEDYPRDWLLPLEILELSAVKGGLEKLAMELRVYLSQMKIKFPEFEKLIDDGLKLIS